MRISWHIAGAKNFDEQLNELGLALGVKVLAAAARKAFMPVIEAAQRLAPIDSEALKDAIKVRVKKPSEGSAVVVGLKIAGPKKNSRKWFERRNEGLQSVMAPSHRWHFAEFGTAHQAMHPFIRPAFDQNAETVVRMLVEELTAGIKRAIKRKAKADAKAAL